MTVTGYVIMNRRGEFYGPGGWVDQDTARVFDVEEASKMLKVFAPDVAVIRVNAKVKLVAVVKETEVVAVVKDVETETVAA